MGVAFELDNRKTDSARRADAKGCTEGILIRFRTLRDNGCAVALHNGRNAAIIEADEQTTIR